LPEELHCLRFINADLIAAGLSPFAPQLAAFKAGRLMLAAIDDAVAKGESFPLLPRQLSLSFSYRHPPA
jgi:predicted ABC-type ATPase